MQTMIEIPERVYGPHCTREQARQLLEALRTAYQALSEAERGLVKAVLGQAASAQRMQEME